MDIDLQLVAMVTSAAVLGSFVGSKLSHALPAEQLRKAFAGFVLIMAAYVVWREAGALPGVAVGLLGAIGACLMTCPKHRRDDDEQVARL